MSTLNKKLIVKNLNFSYEDKKILENINFNINENETVGIIGPSGIGKTTILNIVSGLLVPKKASILLNGVEIMGQKNMLSYMMQDDLLLDYRTAYENISLPLEIKGYSKKDIRDEINKYVELFEIKELMDKYPNELSGGQRQRVAFLRTYIQKKELILLDEAFSKLDYITKHKIYSWFIDIRKKLNLTCLLVTHDIEELILLCDKIYILDNNPASIVAKISKKENMRGELEKWIKKRY